MTHLRKTMLEELERRNYSASTAGCYLRVVQDFARYFQQAPGRLGPDQIRSYQAHLFRDRKLADNTVSQRLAALRFFYLKTLGRSWNLSLTPYPKRARRLPSVLSPKEVARLIDAAGSSFHRMLLMTLYATGVRRAELVRLQLRDIDSERRVVHVRGGKDRDIMLSEQLLAALRQHWRGVAAQADPVVVPGRALAYRRASDQRQCALERLPPSRPAGRHRQAGSSPHVAPLLRHASARSRSGSAHNSNVVGASRSGNRQPAIYSCRRAISALSPAHWTALQLTSSAEQDPGTK